MVNNIKKYTVFAITAVLFLFASCTNLTSGTVSGGSFNGVDGSLIVTVGDVDQYARMLTPVTSGGADDSLVAGHTALKAYRIAGISNTGLSFGPYTLKKADVEGSGYTLTKIPKDDWTFTLSAIDAEVADGATANAYACYPDIPTAKEILKGTASCRMTEATSVDDLVLDFTLSTYGVTTSGSYAFKVIYTGKVGDNNGTPTYDTSGWDDTNYRITTALYDKITGSPIASTVEEFNAEQSKSIKKNGDGGVAVGKTVDPGTYVFGVTVFNGSKELIFASDIIRIEPGRVTNKDFLISDIVPTKPKAPENLRAQRVIGSEDGSSYNVRFSWEDKSANETSFKLVLKEFTKTDAEWAAITGKNTNDEILKNGGSTVDTTLTVYDFDTVKNTTESSEIHYVAGSLYAGSTELVMKLPTGKLYDAQIIAMNTIGFSSGCIRVGSEITGDSAGTGTFSTDPSTTGLEKKTTISSLNEKKFETYDAPGTGTFKRINLVKISYNLDGGKLTAKGTDFTGSTYVDYQIYKLNTEGDDASPAAKYLPLLEIANKGNSSASASATNYILKKGANPAVDFSGWYYYDGTRTEADSQYNYRTYQNITVKAIYGVTSNDITVNAPTVESRASFDDTWVTATLYDGETSKGSIKNGTVNYKPSFDPASPTTKPSVGIEVAQTGYTTGNFRSYTLYINGKEWQTIPASSTAASKFERFTTDALIIGIDNVINISGTTKNGDVASLNAPFTINYSNN